MSSTDEEAIRNLIAEYCQTCDDGRFDAWERIWTDDATFSVMGRTHTGRAALRAFIEAAMPPERRGKHVTINPLVEVAGDEARGSTDFLFVASVDAELRITQVGRYVDEFERTPDGWRIRKREIHLGLG